VVQVAEVFCGPSPLPLSPGKKGSDEGSRQRGPTKERIGRRLALTPALSPGERENFRALFESSMASVSSVALLPFRSEAAPTPGRVGFHKRRERLPLWAGMRHPFRVFESGVEARPVSEQGQRGRPQQADPHPCPSPIGWERGADYVGAQPRAALVPRFALRVCVTLSGFLKVALKRALFRSRGNGVGLNKRTLTCPSPIGWERGADYVGAQPRAALVPRFALGPPSLRYGAAGWYGSPFHGSPCQPPESRRPIVQIVFARSLNVTFVLEGRRASGFRWSLRDAWGLYQRRSQR